MWDSGQIESVECNIAKTQSVSRNLFHEVKVFLSKQKKINAYG